MQTPEQMALSFTGECEPASLGLCANHKAPLGDATTCLHVLHLSELIRARDAKVAAKAWDEGFKQGGPMHDVNYDDPDAHTRNPYEREEGGSDADA